MTSEYRDDVTPDIISPSVFVLRVLRLLPISLTLYPSKDIAFKTDSLTSGETSGFLFITLETLAVDTPASLATSLIVGLPVFSLTTPHLLQFPIKLTGYSSLYLIFNKSMKSPS